MKNYIYTAILTCIIPYIAMSQSLAETVFVAFDVETTGLDAKNERLVEIGAVKFRGDTCIASTNWLINPGRTIPKGVIRVHGITDEMVQDEPHARTVLIEFKKFIGDAPLIAHNARFDVGFIANECHKSRILVPQNHVIDSLPLSRICFPMSPSHRLETLTSYLKIGDTGHHRALADSIYVYQMMAIIFKKMDQDLSLEEIEKMAAVKWPSQKNK